MRSNCELMKTILYIVNHLNTIFIYIVRYGLKHTFICQTPRGRGEKHVF